MNDYRWSWLFVGGLLVSTGALCFCGVFPLFLPLEADAALALRTACVFAFAGVAIFALATSQVAMTAAQHALERRKEFPATFACSIACAVICGLVSIGGVHLSWHFLTIGRPDLQAMWVAVDIGGFLLGIVKPLMAFVIEGRKRLDRIDAAEKDAQERADARARTDADRASANARVAEAQALTAQALRDPRELAQEAVPASAAPTHRTTGEQRSPHAARRTAAGSNARAGQNARPVRSAVRTAARTAAGVGAALIPTAAAAGAPTAIVQQAETVSRKISEAEIIATCLSLRQRGITPSFRLVSAELRVPKTRVFDAWPTGQPLPGARSLAQAG